MNDDIIDYKFKHFDDYSKLDHKPDPTEIIVGERIKKLREEKKLSLKDVAEKTGISPSVISQIENHMISPSLGILTQLASGLGVPMGAFFEDKLEASYAIVRIKDRKNVSRVASKEGVKYGYLYQSLAYNKAKRHMEPFLVILEEATIKDTALSSHDGEEFICVVDGSMKITLGEKVETLETGDCIYFESKIPHRVECVGKQAQLLAVIYTGETKQPNDKKV